MSKIAISVLVLNRKEATRRCLNALLANSHGHEVRLIVTDNGSTDGSREWLEKQVDVIHADGGAITMELFVEPENTGFIPPNNRAFALALQAGADYFIALNNDTVPPPAWLDALIAPLAGDERAAISGPLGTCCELAPTFHGMMSEDAYEYVEGSCLCLKMAAWKVAIGDGPLFSDYLDFAYGEDSDLSLRLRERGCTIHRAEFDMPHVRGETRFQSRELTARCEESQERNHKVLRDRWRHYLKLRRFDYTIVVRRRAALGDVLLAMPVVRAIRESFPCAEVVVDTDCPEVVEASGQWAVGSGQWKNEDGVVVDLDMAYENRPRLSILDAYSAVAHAALPGLGHVETRLELFPTEPDMAWARQMARPRLCVMHCGPTDWPGKNWPLERFRDVALELMEDGWEVCTVGKSNPGLGRHVGTTIGRLGALLRESQLFVGIDSFPMHAALASGCPTVGLFGVTLPDRIVCPGGTPFVGLAADDRIPCAGKRHRAPGLTFVDCDAACIESIQTKQVMEAIGKLT